MVRSAEAPSRFPDCTASSCGLYAGFWTCSTTFLKRALKKSGGVRQRAWLACEGPKLRLERRPFVDQHGLLSPKCASSVKPGSEACPGPRPAGSSDCTSLTRRGWGFLENMTQLCPALWRQQVELHLALEYISKLLHPGVVGLLVLSTHLNYTNISIQSILHHVLQQRVQQQQQRRVQQYCMSPSLSCQASSSYQPCHPHIKTPSFYDNHHPF